MSDVEEIIVCEFAGSRFGFADFLRNSFAFIKNVSQHVVPIVSFIGSPVESYFRNGVFPTRFAQRDLAALPRRMFASARISDISKMGTNVRIIFQKSHHVIETSDAQALYQQIYSDIILPAPLTPSRPDVFHIRLGDIALMGRKQDTEFTEGCSQLQIFIHTKLLISREVNQAHNTVVTGDCSDFLQWLKADLEFKNMTVSDTKPTYVSQRGSDAFVLDIQRFRSAASITCFSVYPWGSGFSRTVAFAYGVPWRKVRINPKKNIPVRRSSRKRKRVLA